MRHTEVGASNAVTSASAVPVGGSATTCTIALEAQAGNGGARRAIELPMLDRIDTGDVGGDVDAVARGGDRADHDVALGDEGGPVGVADLPRSEIERDHATPAGAERGGADQQRIGRELEMADRVDALDQRPPLTGLTVEHVDVGTAPTDDSVDHDIAPIGRHIDIGPRLGRRMIGPDDRIVDPVVAERVMVDRAVVLVVARVPRVVEARAVGLPAEAGRAAVGDLVDQRRAVVGPCHTKHRVLGAAFTDAIGDQRPVRRGEEPVDRHGRVRRMSRRICEHHDGRHRVGERAGHQPRLLGAGITFEKDQEIASHLDALHHWQAHQSDEAFVPHAAFGTAVEHGSGQPVLGLHPADDSGVVAVFEPTIGIGHVDAVEERRHVGAGCLHTGGGRGHCEIT